jgi:hypothetical protein
MSPPPTRQGCTSVTRGAQHATAGACAVSRAPGPAHSATFSVTDVCRDLWLCSSRLSVPYFVGCMLGDIVLCLRKAKVLPPRRIGGYDCALCTGCFDDADEEEEDDDNKEDEWASVHPCTLPLVLCFATSHPRVVWCFRYTWVRARRHALHASQVRTKSHGASQARGRDAHVS